MLERIYGEIDDVSLQYKNNYILYIEVGACIEIFYQGHLEVLPGPVRFYQGPGPGGPWCSYATGIFYITTWLDNFEVRIRSHKITATTT